MNENSTIKICFVTTGDIRSIATAKRAIGMAIPLISFGYRVFIIMEDTQENRSRIALECTKDVEVIYYPKTDSIREIFIKRKILKSISPDFIYICGFVFRNIPLSLNFKTKIFIEHSELQSSIPDIKGLRHFFSIMLEYLSIMHADALLCASKYLENVYIKRSKRIFRSIPVLYYPYAYNDAIYKILEFDEINTDIIKLKDKFNFIYLGTITRNYGIFTILEALKYLITNNKNVRLVVLGSGRHMEEVKDFVNQNNMTDYVLLKGYIDESDIPHYFSVADAFLSPMNDTIQDWARCPSKLYMYLPYKKPIITSKIGETYQTLLEKGHYYLPGDSLSLCQVMENVITSQSPEYLDKYFQHNWYNRSNELHNWILEQYD